MKNFVKKFVSLLLVVLSVTAILPLGISAHSIPSVYYKTHCQNVGWTVNSYNGVMSGTTGRGLRVEALQARISGMSGTISYRSHVQNYGWMSWCSNGQTSGTQGKSLRVEAVQIKLSGDISKQYSIQYRVHVQNYGWMSWCSDGQTAGTVGKSLRVEAIQIKLVKKATSTPSNSTPSPSNTISATVDNGAVYLINFKNTGMGINVQFAPKTGIGNIALDSTANKENNERWLFTYNSKYNAYYITPVYRPGAALNALYGAGCSKGSQAKLHDSNINDTASLWKLEKDGKYYRFKNVACGYYLDIAYGKTAPGTKTNLYSKDNYSGNQLFTLTKVTDAPKYSSSYDQKVASFLNDSRFKNGASYPASQKPMVSSYSSSGCCAYAADFVKVVFNNNSPRGGKAFYNANEIKAGDVIYVTGTDHWFVVISRNGNALKTAEGNWEGKVVVSDSTYSIVNGRIYRNNKPFRTLNVGYHFQ